VRSAAITVVPLPKEYIEYDVSARGAIWNCVSDQLDWFDQSEQGMEILGCGKMSEF